MQASDDGLKGCRCRFGKVISLSDGKDEEWSRTESIEVQAR